MTADAIIGTARKSLSSTDKPRGSDVGLSEQARQWPLVRQTLPEWPRFRERFWRWRRLRFHNSRVRGEVVKVAIARREVGGVRR
jgi:hypothetical protein